MSLVSVIIPCFNQGGFLEDAIRSVLGQTHAELELIIVNDGSTDETEMVSKKYLGDSRCKYVFQENRGLPAARNRGIEESKGVYLNFLDADDWLEPTQLEEQVYILDDEPEIGFVYCDIIQEHQGTQPVSAFSVREARNVLSGDIFGSLLLGGYFPPHTVLIRRDILDKVGPFDIELGGYADYELWLRVVGNGYHAYYLDRKLAHYRLHSDNMSKNWQHMEAARSLAIYKIARLFPDQIAKNLYVITHSIEEMYVAQRWLDEQITYWQGETKQRDAMIQEQRAWIAELEKGKSWLEQQWHYWQAEAERHEATIQEYTKYLNSLQSNSLFRLLRGLGIIPRSSKVS